VIEASQSDLQRGAADLAERFYAQRPRDFGTRLTDWLSEWSITEHASVVEALVDSDTGSGRARHASSTKKATV
jgi:hypothetical protein